MEMLRPSLVGIVVPDQLALFRPELGLIRLRHVYAGPASSTPAQLAVYLFLNIPIHIIQSYNTY
jgi:hypothetical protein